MVHHYLYKIEVHPSYSHQNMTQQYQKWPLQNHFRAKWGLSKCIFFFSPLLKLLFCRQSWGLNWWPCTGSRGNSTPLFCRENEHRDGWNREREREKYSKAPTSTPMPSLHMRHLAKTAQNFWAGCLFEWFEWFTGKEHPPWWRFSSPSLWFPRHFLRQWIAIFYHFPSETSSQTGKIATLVQVSPVFSASSSILWISALISWGFKTDKHGRSVWVPLRFDWRGSVYWHKVTICDNPF